MHLLKQKKQSNFNKSLFNSEATFWFFAIIVLGQVNSSPAPLLRKEGSESWKEIKTLFAKQRGWSSGAMTG
jgi:hypothetical protein